MIKEIKTENEYYDIESSKKKLRNEISKRIRKIANEHDFDEDYVFDKYTKEFIKDLADEICQDNLSEMENDDWDIDESSLVDNYDNDIKEFMDYQFPYEEY